MFKRSIVLLVAVLTGLFVLSACASSAEMGQAKSASSSPPSALGKAVPSDDGTATVSSANGKKVVPLITGAPSTPSVDTTADANTPSTLPAELCPTLVDWASLTDCVENHDLQWYIDGVNQRKGETGFGWSDIVRWASASNADSTEVRGIEVFGTSVSDAEARKRAAELVGDNAQDIVIVHQPACFDNTRGLENGKMSDFVYCPPASRQVRVSLLPAVMQGDKIVGIRDTDSGVFVDCDNVWWIPDTVAVPGRPTQGTPPPPKKTVTPPPPKGTPPPPHRLTPKDWSKNVTPPQGVTRLGPGKKTSGHVSRDQKSSGKTSGNVTDRPVRPGTKSGDTTSDTGSGVKVGGAQSGGDTGKGAVKDNGNNTYDDGGTSGNTEIQPPPD